MAVVHHVETVTVHHLKIARTEVVRLARMKMALPTDLGTGAGVHGRIPAGGRRSLVLKENDMQAVVHRMVQGESRTEDRRREDRHWADRGDHPPEMVRLPND